MSSPIVSTDFDNSASSQTLCDAFRDKLLNNGKHQQLLAYVFDANGNINPGSSEVRIPLTSADTSFGVDLVLQILKSLCPVGSIIQSPGSLALSTSEWKSCDGTTEVVKADYPMLWEAVSGWGLDETNAGANFVLPDLRGRFFLSASGSYPVASDGGSAEITLVADQIPKLEIPVNNADRVGGSTTWSHFDPAGESSDSNVEKPLAPKVDAGAAQTTLVATHEGGGTDGAALPHSNMPPYWSGAVYVRCGYRIGSTVLT